MRTIITAEGVNGARELAAEGITTRVARSFKYRASLWEFGDVTLMDLEGRAFEIKGPHEARNRELICYFVESGHVSMLGARAESFGPGDVVVLPRWSNFHLLVREDTRAIVIRLNVEILEGMLPRQPHEYVHVRDSHLAQASRAFAKSILQGDTSGTAVEKYAIGQLLAEMVGGLLLDSLGHTDENGGASDSTRDRARAIIAQSYADAQLTSRAVATEVNVSLRHLQNAFAEIETTVSDEIRAHRISAAEALLKSARYRVLSVEDIAERAGFGSAVNMRRAFQNAGMPSPSRIRDDHW